MKKAIIVQATIQATKQEAFLKLTEKMRTDSQNEAGCLSYEISKNSNTANSYYFFEIYSDEKAVALHQSSKHFHQFMKEVEPILAELPQIHNFDIPE